MLSKNTYKNDNFYFGKYFIKGIVISLLIMIPLIINFNTWSNLVSPWLLCLIPIFTIRARYIIIGSLAVMLAAVYTFWSELDLQFLCMAIFAIWYGIFSPVWLHTGTHGVFKPKILNSIIGEIAALTQYSSGYKTFRLIHLTHHKYPDHVIMDPHSPRGHTLWSFVEVLPKRVAAVLLLLYTNQWGDSEESVKRWKLQVRLQSTLMITRIVLIYTLLGPKYFILLYMVAFISATMLFAATGYYTHVEREDGSMDIVNLDNNIFYKIINKLFWGAFMHDNHHKKPKLINPGHMPIERKL